MSAKRKTEELAVQVRHMAAEDLERICELEVQIFPDPWPASAFVEQLDLDGWGTLVAEVDNQIAGYACYMMVANESHLTNIAVDPAWRRKSVARALLDSILEIVTANKCDMLLLEVRCSNAEARAFYVKHGFKELYKRPKYYRRPVEDALVMVRHLNDDTGSAK
ncbi:MAG: ribosomal protein S18-alanine N-acetyltransferase [Candidatus Zixiibacteriota bacterium]